MLQFHDKKILASFVLSNERSGSTLLRQILDTHSSICSPGELCLGSLASELEDVFTRTLTPHSTDGARFSKRKAQKQVIEEVRNIIDGIMNSYAQKKGKKIWCDKTPYNSQFTEVITRVFPDAKYICLHRDARDVVNSCIHSVKTNGPMFELRPFIEKHPNSIIRAMTASWISKTSTILAFERKNKDNCFRIKYEDIVCNPTNTLVPMFEFMGVEFESEVIEKALISRHDLGGGDYKIHRTKKIKNRTKKGRGIDFSVLEKEQLEMMNALLKTLGYPIVELNRKTTD